ncbi:MAG: hypothetical protein OXU79_11300 [Gemmatimonadota bacterium]|nr:hypothetical protein [Gemmatimonadota bacterium]
MNRPVVLAGLRPMGSAHQRDYFEFLKPLLDRQGEARCFIMITDYLSLGAAGGDSRKVQEDVTDLVMDVLASGFDPERGVCFLQSQVPQLGELAIILDHSLRPPAPTGILRVRDRPDATRQPLPSDSIGYAALQTADLLLFRPASVFVAPDQRPYVEQTRQRARRFNREFGPVFPETKCESGEEQVGSGRNIGMSGYHTDRIDVLESAKRVPAKAHGVSMDTGRALPAGAGEPSHLPEPLKSARAKLEGRRSLVRDILHLGGSDARIEGQRTLELVKEAVGLRYGNLLI